MKKFMLPSIAAIQLVLVTSIPADAQRFARCFYLEVSQCAPGQGCTGRPAPNPEERWIEVQTPYGELPRIAAEAAAGRATPPVVRRCERSGCDEVAIEAERTGGFLTLRQPQASGAWFLKMATPAASLAGIPDGIFVEVATQLLGTIVYYGGCPSMSR